MNYRNISLLNCSSWLRETDYQKKVGLVPQPGRAVIVNLQNREIKIMKFIEEKKDGS
jgi:DNA polymerase II small subunit/DNA polymerase delta subunit B